MVSATPSDRRAVVAALARTARRLGGLSALELLTTLHALVVLAGVELTIRWVPLPRLGGLLGVGLNLAPARPGAGPVALGELPPRARRQLICTRRVADVWPFSRGPCLRRSLVGGHLIRDLGPAIRIGVADDHGSPIAHAWLELDERPLEPVTGFTPFQRVPAGDPS